MEGSAAHQLGAATLRDGRTVTLRTISAADAELLHGLFDHLSERSRYQRFLSFRREQSDDERHRLTDVDHHEHEAVIALADDGAMVGVARYVRLRDHPGVAEVAVTVVDDWQADGLGTLLLARLADRARADGLERFQALMLETNRTMMDLFEHLGPVRIVDHDAGTVEVEIALTADEEGGRKMFDRVLIAYEGSEQSEDALALGRELAGPSGQLVATCAYWYQPRSARVGKGPHGEAALRVDAQAVLDVLREREGDELEVRAAAGPTPAAALHELLEHEHFDLVVVGSTRRAGIGHVLAGSTATTLLHGSPVAVAVAPAGYREATPATPRRIGVAYDGSPTAALALQAAFDIAAARGARLAVLNAFDRIPAYALAGPGEGLPPGIDLRATGQGELDDALARCPEGVDAHGELLEGRPAEALLARTADLDLLVMGSRGYGRIRGVVLGSMSRRLVEEAACPVLVVPNTGA